MRKMIKMCSLLLVLALSTACNNDADPTTLVNDSVPVVNADSMKAVTKAVEDSVEQTKGKARSMVESVDMDVKATAPDAAKK
jgi:ABC-type molybdate transport system substrate-binding protein